MATPKNIGELMKNDEARPNGLGSTCRSLFNNPVINNSLHRVSWREDITHGRDLLNSFLKKYAVREPAEPSKVVLTPKALTQKQHRRSKQLLKQSTINIQKKEDRNPLPWISRKLKTNRKQLLDPYLHLQIQKKIERMSKQLAQHKSETAPVSVHMPSQQDSKRSTNKRHCKTKSKENIQAAVKNLRVREFDQIDRQYWQKNRDSLQERLSIKFK